MYVVLRNNSSTLLCLISALSRTFFEMLIKYFSSLEDE